MLVILGWFLISLSIIIVIAIITVFVIIAIDNFRNERNGNPNSANDINGLGCLLWMLCSAVLLAIAISLLVDGSHLANYKPLLQLLGM